MVLRDSFEINVAFHNYKSHQIIDVCLHKFVGFKIWTSDNNPAIANSMILDTIGPLALAPTQRKTAALDVSADA